MKRGITAPPLPAMAGFFALLLALAFLDRAALVLSEQSCTYMQTGHSPINGSVCKGSEFIELDFSCTCFGFDPQFTPQLNASYVPPTQAPSICWWFIATNSSLYNITYNVDYDGQADEQSTTTNVYQAIAFPSNSTPELSYNMLYFLPNATNTSNSSGMSSFVQFSGLVFVATLACTDIENSRMPGMCCQFGWTPLGRARESHRPKQCYCGLGDACPLLSDFSRLCSQRCGCELQHQQLLIIICNSAISAMQCIYIENKVLFSFSQWQSRAPM